MSQPTVARLKELLFDEEAREIDVLAERIDRLDARAGGDQQLRTSVARVIDGALRDAEVDRHRDLADAMAPVVVRTVRTEIASPNTQDQIAGALYPRIGDMVRKYVASAMRDLMEGINRKLESGLTGNRLMLRLRSLTSGRSLAEQALADTQSIAVEELYLIRRGSGELIHRWSRDADARQSGNAGSNRDTLVSGFLTAVTAFAEEAFEADKASLRTLDLDNHRIYLRGSPAHLLAVKCSGSAPGGIEALLDGELLAVLAEHQKIDAAVVKVGRPEAREDARRAHERALDDLALRLETGIAERSATSARSQGGLRPLKVLFWLIAVPLLAYAGWQAYLGYLTRQTQAAADSVVASMPELAGYPVKARAERGGQALWVVGLTPSAPVRDQLVTRLKALAPAMRVTDTLGVLPQADVGAAVQTASLRTALGRAEQRLLGLAGELAAAAARLGRDEAGAALAAAQASVAETARDIAAARPEHDDAALAASLAGGVSRLEADVARLADVVRTSGGPQLSPMQPLVIPPTARLSWTLADRLALLGERIGVLAMAAEQAKSAATERARAVAPLHQQIAELTRRIDALNRAPTPREELEGFIRQNAIFFANGADFRDTATVAAKLDALAGLIKRANLAVRVVGYTDEAGGPTRNQPLSQQRADRVLEELVGRGVPRARLVAVGRGTALELAPRVGATSPSRRVEIEIAFSGEEIGAP